MVFILTFGYLLLWLIAYYPGGFAPDCINQYSQVVSGSYNNWHPVLHTWLFFWLPYQLFHCPAGIVLFQILLFSLVVWYLYQVLCRRNCPMWFLIASWLFLILNPQTAKIMMFPWKDSALSIVTLLVFTYIVEIYETQGEWLEKWYHFLAFTAVCFLTTVFRHNAILLTAPIYVILLVFQKRQRKVILLSCLLVLFSVWFLNGPVMSLAHVAAPRNRQTETLGLPMTILSGVYMNERESLSESAVRFLDSIATQEEWNTYFRLGNFNMLKFNVQKSVAYSIESEGAKNILGYTIQAFRSCPFWSLQAFASLTQIVWNPVAYPGWQVAPPYCSDNSIGLTMQPNTLLSQALICFSDSTESLFLIYFTRLVGMMILILMFAAVTNVGRGRLGRAFMIFPMLIYDFGTMLLLTGPDFRFFHFNFVIIIPLLYLILSDQAPKKSSLEVTNEKQV